MKYLTLALCSFSIFLLIGCKEDTQVRLGEPTPPISATTLDGKQANLEQFKNKNIALIFFRNGCSSCLKSLPKLEEAAETYGDKLEVVAINSTDSQEVIERFLERNSFNKIEFLKDNLSITSKRFGIVATPTIVIMDSNHIVREKVVGERPWQITQGILDSLLGVSS